jgi:hypothetical protein
MGVNKNKQQRAAERAALAIMGLRWQVGADGPKTVEDFKARVHPFLEREALPKPDSVELKAYGGMFEVFAFQYTEHGVIGGVVAHEPLTAETGPG